MSGRIKCYKENNILRGEGMRRKVRLFQTGTFSLGRWHLRRETRIMRGHKTHNSLRGEHPGWGKNQCKGPEGPVFKGPQKPWERSSPRWRENMERPQSKKNMVQLENREERVVFQNKMGQARSWEFFILSWWETMRVLPSFQTHHFQWTHVYAFLS